MPLLKRLKIQHLYWEVASKCNPNIKTSEFLNWRKLCMQDKSVTFSRISNTFMSLLTSVYDVALACTWSIIRSCTCHYTFINFLYFIIIIVILFISFCYIILLWVGAAHWSACPVSTISFWALFTFLLFIYWLRHKWIDQWLVPILFQCCKWKNMFWTLPPLHLTTVLAHCIGTQLIKPNYRFISCREFCNVRCNCLNQTY